MCDRSRPPRRLVVNADDFGLSPEVNAGILRAFRLGIVRSTSLLAAGQAFEEAADSALKTPGLDVGVHLAMFEVRPILPTPAVSRWVDSDGHFAPTPLRAMGRLLAPGPGLQQLEMEFRAQIDRVRAIGLSISHLNCHGHLQVWPQVFRIVVRLALEYRIPWVRLPREDVPLRRCLRSLRATQLLAAGALCRLGERFCGASGSWPRRADRVVGIEVSGHLDEQWLCRQIQRLRPGVTELVCHPGCSTSADVTLRQPVERYQRRQEAEALSSPQLQRALSDNGIEVTSFRKLAELEGWVSHTMSLCR